MEIATKTQIFLFQLGVSPLKILLILVLLGVAFLLFMVFSAAHVKVDKRDIYPLPKEKERDEGEKEKIIAQKRNRKRF